MNGMEYLLKVCNKQSTSIYLGNHKNTLFRNWETLGTKTRGNRPIRPRLKVLIHCNLQAVFHSFTGLPRDDVEGAFELLLRSKPPGSVSTQKPAEGCADKKAARPRREH